MRVRCLLAIVSLGTGASDPRSAREVVAAFSEVMAGDSPTPEETAAMVSQEVAVALPKRGSRRVLSKQPKAAPPTARYVPLASDTRTRASGSRRDRAGSSSGGAWKGAIL